jgi:hypothetical protein
VVVTSSASRDSRSRPALAAAIGVAFLIGALGCGCVGAWGVAALVIGLGASVAAARLVTRVRRAPGDQSS